MTLGVCCAGAFCAIAFTIVIWKRLLSALYLRAANEPTPGPGLVLCANVPDDAVVVSVVPGEEEAEIVCGLLRFRADSNAAIGSQAVDSPLEGLAASGPREILVHQKDLEAAKALLA